MKNTNRISHADSADRFLQLMALAMFLMAIVFVIGAVRAVVGEQYAPLLTMLERVFAIAMLLVLVPSVIWKWIQFRDLKFAERRSVMMGDGFIQTHLERAMARSWGVTFLSLVAGKLLVLDYLPTLSSEFYLEVIPAVMLVAFAVTFFISIGFGSNHHET